MGQTEKQRSTKLSIRILNWLAGADQQEVRSKRAVVTDSIPDLLLDGEGIPAYRVDHLLGAEERAAGQLS